jgi:hypothetical protein
VKKDLTESGGEENYQQPTGTVVGTSGKSESESDRRRAGVVGSGEAEELCR